MSRSRVWTIAFAVALVAVLATLYWCTSKTRAALEAERAREAFVSEFVVSIQENTEFYRRFVAPEDLGDVQTSRALISDHFSVIGVEDPVLWGSEYQYVLCFTNGSWGYVDVLTDNHVVASARFRASPASRTARCLPRGLEGRWSPHNSSDPSE